MSDRVVILGAGGQLGSQLVPAFQDAGYTTIGRGREVLDISAADAQAKLTALQPDIVVNAAAWTDVDGCSRDPERALEVNGAAPGRLAETATELGAQFIQISTNEVFDGHNPEPYVEESVPNPINPYGVSKLAGEVSVAAANPANLIIRTAWLFGPGGNNFPSKILGAARRAAERGEPLQVVDDEFGNPSWAPALASAIVAALGARATGILHIAGEPPVSRFGWAQVILDSSPAAKLVPIPATAYPRPSPVPPRAVLSMGRADGLGLPRLLWERFTREYAGLLSREMPA